MKYVRQYFTDGTLPKPGTVCEVKLGPFDSFEGGFRSTEDEDAQGRLDMDLDMNEEDRKLLSAVRELSSSSPFTTKFHPPFSMY
jgi:hypothetical protein